jgi:hypothetical protein
MEKIELCEFCYDSGTMCTLANYIWKVVSVSLGINSIPFGFDDIYCDWFNTGLGFLLIKKIY